MWLLKAIHTTNVNKHIEGYYFIIIIVSKLTVAVFLNVAVTGSSNLVLSSPMTEMDNILLAK